MPLPTLLLAVQVPLQSATGFLVLCLNGVWHQSPPRWLFSALQADPSRRSPRRRGRVFSLAPQALPGEGQCSEVGGWAGSAGSKDLFRGCTMGASGSW